MYVIKKLFRKVFIVLAIMEASDRASSVFHYAYLLTLAGRKCSANSEIDDVTLVRLREVVGRSVEQLEMSPLRNIFRGIIKLNRSILSQAGRTLITIWQKFRRGARKGLDAQEEIREEEKRLADLTKTTTEKILGEKGYLISLEKVFDSNARGLL
jgi:hypothetical protein